MNDQVSVLKMPKGIENIAELTPEQKEAYLKEFLNYERMRKKIKERMRILEQMEMEKRREALDSFLSGDEAGF